MSDYKCAHCVRGPVYTDTEQLLDHYRTQHREKDLTLLVRNVSFSERGRNRFYVRRRLHASVKDIIGRDVTIDDQMQLRWGGSTLRRRHKVIPPIGTTDPEPETQHALHERLHGDSADGIDDYVFSSSQSSNVTWADGQTDASVESGSMMHSGMGSLVVHLSTSSTSSAPDEPVDDPDTDSDDLPKPDITQAYRQLIEKSKHHHVPDLIKHIDHEVGQSADTNTDCAAPSGGPVRSHYEQKDAGVVGNNKNVGLESSSDGEQSHEVSTESPYLRAKFSLEASMRSYNQLDTDSSLANSIQRKLATADHDPLLRQGYNDKVSGHKPELPPKPPTGFADRPRGARHSFGGVTLKRTVNVQDDIIHSRKLPEISENITSGTNNLDTSEAMGANHSEHNWDNYAKHGTTEAVRSVQDLPTIGKINNRYSTGALLDMQRAQHGYNPDNEGSILANINVNQLEQLPSRSPVPRRRAPPIPSKPPNTQPAQDYVDAGSMPDCDSIDAFRRFASTDIFNDVIRTFEELRTLVGVSADRPRDTYNAVKRHVTSPQAIKLFRLLDSRKGNAVYGGGNICQNVTILVTGGGPCGLRAAIECALMGARVVVLEMRNYSTRNNVLHLWPIAANDIKSIGAKVFYPKFCAGAIHHVSIRRLQLVLMKIALILGVEIYSPVTFEDIIQPDPVKGTGWRARVTPANCPVSKLDFDVVIGADGKRNSLDFPRKFTRGKVSIAITANFKNPGQGLHAHVAEIPGIVRFRRPELFAAIEEESGLEFENFVYFRDETHYFIMTAKKKSLVEKGIVKRENADLRAMFHPDNVDRSKMLATVRKIASTAWRVDNPSFPELPDLEFEMDRYGKEDVAIFDFAALHQAEHACLIKERHGKKLLQCIVGDSLLEPFWPTGSGIAKGFLGVLDAAWTIRNWTMGDMTDLEVIAERESVFRVLPQVTPENLNKNANECTLDPATRYKGTMYGGRTPLDTVKPSDVTHLYNTSDAVKRKANGINMQGLPMEKRRLYRGGSIDTHRLVSWFKERLQPFAYMCPVTDLAKSWNTGLALCALIQTERPELMNVESLDRNDCRGNIQKAFRIIESEFGVEQMMAPDDLANKDDPDRLTMMSYLFHIYEHIMTQNDPKLPKIEASGKPQESPSSAYSLINTIANSDVLLNTLKRDAKRIQNADIQTLARKASISGDAGLNYYLQTASLGRRDKIKVHMAVRKAKTIKPEQTAAREWRRKTRAKLQKRKAAQYYENYDLPSKPPTQMTLKTALHPTQIDKQASHSSDYSSPTPANQVPPSVSHIQPQKTQPTEPKDHAIKRGVTFSREAKQDDGPDRELTAEEEEAIKKQLSLSRQACGGVAADRIKAFSNLDNGKENVPVASPVLKRRSAFRLSKGSSAEMSTATLERKKQTGDICCICDKKLYIVERHCAHGYFLHRTCFKCKTCGTNLRVGNNVVIPDDNDNPHFYCYAHAYQAGLYDVKWKANKDPDVTMPEECSTDSVAADFSHFGPLTQEELQFIGSEEEDSDTDIEEEYEANLPPDDNTATLTGPVERVHHHARDVSEDADSVSDAASTSTQLLEQEEIQQGLDDLENERTLLEERGILLEQELRHETGDRLSKVGDDLMNAWLNIAHEKKELKEKEAKLMLKLRLMGLQQRLAAMLEMMTGVDDDEASTQRLDAEVSQMETEDAAINDEVNGMVEEMQHLELYLKNASHMDTHI